MGRKNKWVDLSKLPTHQKRHTIIWSKTVGYIVPFTYDDICGELEIIEINDRKIFVKYNNKINELWIRDFSNCKIGKLIGKRTIEFKYNIGDVIKNEKINFTILEREYRYENNGQKRKWYKLKCNNCKWDECWLDEARIKKKSGCAVCNSYIVVPHINSLAVTNPWMIKFLANKEDAYKYTARSNKYVSVICPDCGKIKDKEMTLGRLYTTKSIGCICNDKKSYPEKFMMSVLKQLNINFITEYSPKWCVYEFKRKLRHGRYDFYFKHNDLSYIIETDGDLHNKYNARNTQTVEESRYIDFKKDELASEQNIIVTRIDCRKSERDFIKNNILQSNLSLMFDLNLVNWDICAEFALSNIIKSVCKHKSENPNLSVVELSQIFNICKVTVVKYLKTGSDVGWVQYDPVIERKNGTIKRNKLSAKPVLCVDINKRFSDAKQCAEYFSTTLNMELNYRSIQQVCRGRNKSYRGYIFKYIS